MVVRWRKGRSVVAWELKDSKHKRNEPLDLRNYATAALEIANPILQEGEIAKRRIAFAGYQINDEIMAAAKPDAMVMHCLPAHREEEITAKVFEEHAKEIFEEAENRLHAQKAVMVRLMAD